MLARDAGGASAQVLDRCPALAELRFGTLTGWTSCPGGAGLQAAGSEAAGLQAAGFQAADEPPELSPGRAFLYSALVPGLGQLRQGKRRWIAYLAVEGAFWIALGRARSSATDLRRQYRDLAWDVGRSFNGARVDGDFPYYEAMEKFEASGSFDTDPVAPGIQPQMDPSTFNGRAWSLATEIHFPPGANPGPGDPEYEAALADYRARAYNERFEWSWAGQSVEFAEYKDLIDSSDDYFRRASQFLGAVVANHLLSGIDAFVTARLLGSIQGSGFGGNQTEVRIRLVPGDDRKGLGLVLQIRH